MAAGFDAFQDRVSAPGFAVMAAGLDAFLGESRPRSLRDGRRTRRIPKASLCPQGFVMAAGLDAFKAVSAPVCGWPQDSTFQAVSAPGFADGCRIRRIPRRVSAPGFV